MPQEYEWDIFISHASEDKDSFVRPLADALRKQGLRVWYDEFTLKLGAGLRSSIDTGLAKSKFGLVVLSHDFFRKPWPQRELDGLVQREVSEGQLILPIRHHLTVEEVRSHSPPLADKISVDAELGMEHVVAEILKVVKPDASKCLLLFNAGYVVVPHDPTLEPRSFTVEAWVFALGGGQDNAAIIRKAKHNGAGYILRWRHLADPHVQLRLDRQPRPSVVAKCPENIRGLQGRWIHIAGAFDCSLGLAYLFVDGKLQERTRAKPSQMFYSADSLTIGGSPNAEDEGFHGAIRSVRISRSVLYTEDYDPQQSMKPEAETILFMPLNDNRRSETVTDSVGNRTGNLVRARWISDADLQAASRVVVT